MMIMTMTWSITGPAFACLLFSLRSAVSIDLVRLKGTHTHGTSRSSSHTRTHIHPPQSNPVKPTFLRKNQNHRSLLYLTKSGRKGAKRTPKHTDRFSAKWHSASTSLPPRSSFLGPSVGC
jgi:hypothetical protein